MLAFDEYSPHEASRLPDRNSSSLRRVAGAVLHVAATVLDMVTISAPPEYTSEHFGHAQKRNDLRPDVDLAHTR